MATSPRDVAEFMIEYMGDSGWLEQADVVYEIQDKYGDEFAYDNENGNLAIDRKVLAEFKKLTPDLVWERGTRMWRKRSAGEQGRSAE